MTPKERAAMQQALGALVRAEDMYGQPNADIQTALREALAGDNMSPTEQAQQETEDLDWITPEAVFEAKLKLHGITNQPVKQAEQEPVGYFAYDEEHDIWEELTGPNAPGATPLYTALQPVKQEPVGYVQYFGNKLCFRESAKNGWYPVFLNAAPVRTKDLTDDEIMKINVDTAGIVPTCDRQFHFARAVIAADRKLNGVEK